MSLPQYLRAEQVAERLSLSERTVLRWAAQGRIPSVRIAGARLFPEDGVRRALEDNQSSDNVVALRRHR